VFINLERHEYTFNAIVLETQDHRKAQLRAEKTGVSNKCNQKKKKEKRKAIGRLLTELLDVLNGSQTGSPYISSKDDFRSPRYMFSWVTLTVLSLLPVYRPTRVVTESFL
jgi:hypothetical protein